MITRRELIRRSALVGAGLVAGTLPRGARGQSWRRGGVNHILPLVSHHRLLLKVSFREPQRRPRLRVGRRAVEGEKTDTRGRYFQFLDVGVEADTTYELVLESGPGQAMTEPWPLKTLPSPESRPSKVRVMIFTCAGGFEGLTLLDGRSVFQPMAVRRRLLARGLALRPDVVVGVGDQVYWDQHVAPRRNTPQYQALRRRWYEPFGSFDLEAPVLGSANEDVLTRGLDAQIAALYGVDFRSIPVILTQDDHDHFENDEASDALVTFPPSPFNLALAQASQRLYYPEFLPDPARPRGIAGGFADGHSQTYGSFRFGRLLEMLFYDCRRYLTLKGPTAGFIDASAERWLLERTRAEAQVRHLVHVPSTPMGWSAGKWGEWYPDLLQPDGTLAKHPPKPYWQHGWWTQHQRLLQALSGQQERLPLVVSGDLHAIGSGRIQSSGDLVFKRPVETVLAGPISSDDAAWPSAFRGTGPQVPSDVTVSERLKLPVEAIDTLSPVSEFRLGGSGHPV